jgi:TonB-linked SusC/RagA family outer membrane protein
MKKVLRYSLILCLLLGAKAYAQDRVVSGKVTAADDKLPIPGVTVKAVGASAATQTNADGLFTLSIPEGVTQLQFSFLGYATRTLPIAAGILNVVLKQDSEQLQEVIIVGALGTKRSARSTSSNTQSVDAKQLNTVQQTNLNNALAGKVSGIQVRSQSAAALGRNTEVRLRGVSGLGTGTGALYIVNGTVLPNVDDINIDDIENVSVLQGAAAAAQFGSQGANGAIIITLKDGKEATNGLGVNFSTGMQFEKAYILPNYQNTYAGGAASDLMQYTYKAGDPVEWQALSGKYYHDYSDDASWGPRMVGQEYIPWYAWYAGSPYSYKTAKLTPQPDNAKDFYSTGITRTNNISLSTASDVMKFKFTYANQDIDGLLYGTSLKKNTLNLVTSYKLNDHFEVSADINYINQRQSGEIDDLYSNQSSGSFNQWFHRDLDMGIMKELQNLTTPEGVYASWNHANPDSFDAANPRNFYAGNYWYNFYTYFNLVDVSSQRDRLYGNLSLTYKVNQDLKFSATYRKQQASTFAESKYSSRLALSGLQTSGNSPETKGYYATGTSFSNRRNIEFLASYTKKIKDFSIDANLGADFFSWTSKSNTANTNNGLSVSDLFTLSNSVDQPTIGNGRVEEKYRAILGKATFGYKNLLFADITLRNDWFSTLPLANNSVLSKSVGGSFVFSDLLKENTPWLSYGKLRGSWGEIPKALGTTNDTFGAYRYPGSAYGVSQFKWGSEFLMNAADILVDPNIKGSVVTQSEFGIDLSFLDERAGLSATYWKGSEKDFPYALSLNGATGYTSLLTNIGEISKKGVDVQLNFKPIVSDKLTWGITGTWSRLIANDVVSLSEKYGITQTQNVSNIFGTTTGMPYMVHKEGMRWGQLYGNGIKRINGQPVLNANGQFVNDPNVYFGSVLPDYTGGLQNSFTFLKDFSLNVNIDFQYGGKFVSLSNMWGSFSGLTAQTAAMNDKGNPIRDPVADGGGVHVFGVDANGVPVSYYVDGQDYYHQFWNNKTFDPFIYDLTFVKMREVALGYTIPVKKLRLNKFIQTASLSLIARNPLLIYATTKDFDPSEISSVSGETGQLPGTRGLGFNLKIGF